jgi:hypothetical protein
MLPAYGHGTDSSERTVETVHGALAEEHRLSPGLRLRDDGLLVYDSGQTPLL